MQKMTRKERYSYSKNAKLLCEESLSNSFRNLCIRLKSPPQEDTTKI